MISAAIAEPLIEPPNSGAMKTNILCSKRTLVMNNKEQRHMRELIIGIKTVIPVITIYDTRHAEDLAKALVAGGLFVFEIVLRTDCALRAVEIMARAVPEAKVGMGTVMNAAQIDQARNAGAAFGVSPGLTPRLVEALRDRDWPFLPGVQTASEVMAASEAGFRELKLFPANLVGGVSWLRFMRPIFPDVAFFPTGGIKSEEVPTYLAEANCCAVGGSWVVPADEIRARNWRAIEALALQAAALGKST
jgi:2-dehydro-3-deoxyphosphogluconate aldolase/(4S)-4-hydroxy-2-oxoglutarate aldolase